MSECFLCKKEIAYDPYCCKEKLEWDVQTFIKAMRSWWDLPGNKNELD